MLDAAGLDSLLIGDSLGMVLQGHDTTLPVTLADMAYHTRCVARGSKRSFLVADMPFGSYQESPQQAFRSAAELMAAGAQMVKLEGGAEFADTIRFLTQRGVPVCGHLGLTPQSVHQFGGYRVQGKGEDAEQKLIEDAVELEAAGAGLIVLEAIPAKLGEAGHAAPAHPDHRHRRRPGLLRPGARPARHARRLSRKERRASSGIS